MTMSAVDVPVRCQCGSVRGVAHDVSPHTVNRAICYCHDCRAFVHWLERDDLLDGYGGSELVQLARSRFEINEGAEQLRCMRLSEKGMYRWYTACCRTPMANTVAAIPFVGVARNAFAVPAQESLARFGTPLATQPAKAVGGRPPGVKMELGGLLHVVRLLAAWWLGGRGHPTPFFDRDNRPTRVPQVLTSVERQKLREHPRV